MVVDKASQSTAHAGDAPGDAHLPRPDGDDATAA